MWARIIDSALASTMNTLPLCTVDIYVLHTCIRCAATVVYKSLRIANECANQQFNFISMMYICVYFCWHSTFYMKSFGTCSCARVCVCIWVALLWNGLACCFTSTFQELNIFHCTPHLRNCLLANTFIHSFIFVCSHTNIVLLISSGSWAHFGFYAEIQPRFLLAEVH